MTPSSSTVGEIRYDAIIDTSKLKSSAKDADSIAEQFGNNLEKNGSRSFKNFAQSASQSFGSVADSIGNFAKKASLVLIGGGIGLGAFIKEASNLQSVRASFESMTGSASEAEKVLRQLNKFSFETAFSTREINAAARTLLGAGLSVDDLGKRMKQIGDVAGATGADLGRLTLPLSQAIARGKLQTQDFYQILDSGAGSLGKALRENLAKRGMGDFMKAMEEGKVTSEILFETLQQSAEKGGFAFDGAIRQAQTFSGRMSNLKETVYGVGLELLGIDKATGKIDPDGAFAKMSDAVQSATDWLSENKDTILSIASTIKDNLLPAIAGIATAYTTAKVAAILFQIAAMTGPQLIAVAIVALIGGLVYLYTRFEWFRNAVNGVFNFIKENWQLMLIFMTAGFGLLVVAIINHWEKIKAVVTGAINFIKENWQLMLIFLTAGFGLIVVAIINHFEKIKAVANIVKNAIVSAFQWAWDRVTGIWGAITGFFSNIGSGIKSAISGAMEGLKDSVKSAINWVIDKANFAIRAVNKASPPGIPEIGEIPKLAKGGIIPATPGGRIVQVAEAGQAEAIIPLSKLDAMFGDNMGSYNNSSTYNFNVTGVLARSEADLRDITKQMIGLVDQERKARGEATIL